jgi:DNA modification methylase
MDYELTAWKTLAEFDKFTRAWVTACAAVLRHGGWMCVEVQDMHVSPEHPHAAPGQKEQSCMGTHAKIVLAMMDAGLLLKACAVWNRGRWSGNAARLTCAPGSPALLCHHSNLLFARKPGGRPGAYDFPELTNSDKAIWCRSVWDHVQPQAVEGHPCAMPEKMAAGMVMGWSLPPDTILDPFMGSGTVGLAAIRHGRKFVGIEQDAGYFDLARKRLERELAQGVLPFQHNAEHQARVLPSPECSCSTGGQHGND